MKNISFQKFWIKDLNKIWKNNWNSQFPNKNEWHTKFLFVLEMLWSHGGLNGPKYRIMAGKFRGNSGEFRGTPWTGSFLANFCKKTAKNYTKVKGDSLQNLRFCTIGQESKLFYTFWSFWYISVIFRMFSWCFVVFCNFHLFLVYFVTFLCFLMFFVVATCFLYF